MIKYKFCKMKYLCIVFYFKCFNVEITMLYNRNQCILCKNSFGFPVHILFSNLFVFCKIHPLCYSPYYVCLFLLRIFSWTPSSFPQNFTKRCSAARSLHVNLLVVYALTPFIRQTETLPHMHPQSVFVSMQVLWIIYKRLKTTRSLSFYPFIPA